ncbi:toxin [Caldibacillus lycopersici]|uniref:Toxin n=1 Tax=Perspicuibacillus lycopersici TaxID=1325689 RepID=A0AAE3IU47_9BACI|nr:toxin [Perspicuibacillus lycopersici]MCU9613638.1 toxin [Perspicuibacillus lycopersici]
MRKQLLILLLFAMLVFCQQSTAAFKSVFLENIKNASSLATIPLHSRELLESIILLPTADFNEIAAGKMIQRIDQLPATLLQKIKDNKIIILLFNGKLTDQPTTRHMQGLTPRGYAHTTTTWDDVPGSGGSDIVLVKIGASDKGSGHGSVNLELHELAHSIDKIVFNRIRDEEQFLSIWREEVDPLFGSQPYFQTYPEEYFAESFAMFYAYENTREMLKEKAPKTYAYIAGLK